MVLVLGKQAHEDHYSTSWLLSGVLHFMLSHSKNCHKPCTSSCHQSSHVVSASEHCASEDAVNCMVYGLILTHAPLLSLLLVG